MADITKEQVVDFISSMSVLELSEMITEMEEKFGVSAAAAVAAAPAADGGGDEQAAAEEKVAFTVVLLGAGDKKINVIKEVRAMTGLGLKEAKDFVEGAPNNVKEGVTKEEAETVMAKLQEIGASVEIK